MMKNTLAALIAMATGGKTPEEVARESPGTAWMHPAQLVARSSYRRRAQQTHRRKRAGYRGRGGR